MNFKGEMMADLPAQNPAVDPASPQNPGQQPATTPAEQPAAQQPNDGTQTVAPVTLTEEQKTYLKGQGLSDADLTAPDALAKIINHAQSSQKTLSETNAQLEKIKGAVVPQPEVPANPLQVEPASQQTQNGQPQAQQPQTLDEVSALTLSTSLALAYPKLKDDFVSGDIYKNMQTMGIPMHTADGKINLAGIQNYAQFASAQKELEEKSQPNPDSVPDVNPSTPQQPDENFEMDKQKALAILAQDPNHPRAAEALQFIQSGK